MVFVSIRLSRFMGRVFRMLCAESMYGMKVNYLFFSLLKIHGKTELVTSSKRPVPLTWHFSTKTSLLPLLDEKGTRMNRYLLISSKVLAIDLILFNLLWLLGMPC